jgi:hypothetical protein
MDRNQSQRPKCVFSLICLCVTIIIIFACARFVSSAYPIWQSNAFTESENMLLILKGSLFSAHGLGASGMGRGAESIRPFREEFPLVVRD